MFCMLVTSSLLMPTVMSTPDPIWNGSSTLNEPYRFALACASAVVVDTAVLRSAGEEERAWSAESKRVTLCTAVPRTR